MVAFITCLVLIMILVMLFENLKEIMRKENKERRKIMDLSMSWSDTGLNEVREDKERKGVDK